MELIRHLTFASEAEWLAIWGAGFLTLAVFAGYMERRQTRRLQVDRVGWVPWFAISFTAIVFGCGFLALSFPALLRG